MRQNCGFDVFFRFPKCYVIVKYCLHKILLLVSYIFWLIHYTKVLRLNNESKHNKSHKEIFKKYTETAKVNLLLP